MFRSFRSLTLASVAGLALAFPAAAQVQSWNYPISVGPYSGDFAGSIDRSTQGLNGTFGYTGSEAQNGYSGSQTGTDAWSLSRGDFNDTLGAAGSLAGHGNAASGLALGAGSFTPNGGSVAYGAAGSIAGNGRSASGLTTGAAPVR